MPRYFFDVYDGVALPDQVGKDCADLDEAQVEATNLAAKFLGASPLQIWREKEWTIWVRDESGLQLFSVVVLGTLSAAGTRYANAN